MKPETFIIVNPTAGDGLAQNRWQNFENDLKENIYDRLENNSYSQSFVSRKFIDNLLKNERTFSREKRAKILWNLYTLEVWYSNYINHSVIE